MTPQHIMRDGDELYIHSMGKRLRITAIFSDDNSANDYMRKHSEAACIASFGPFVFIANKYDHGI